MIYNFGQCMDKVAIVGNSVQREAFLLEMHLPMMCLRIEGATSTHNRATWVGVRPQSHRLADGLMAKSWSVTVHTLIDWVVRLGVRVLSAEVAIRNCSPARAIGGLSGFTAWSTSGKLKAICVAIEVPRRMYSVKMVNGPLRGVVSS